MVSVRPSNLCPITRRSSVIPVKSGAFGDGRCGSGPQDARYPCSGSRSTREAASRGFSVSSYVPHRYRKVRIKAGARERPELELDPPADAVVRRNFDTALEGLGVLDIVGARNDEASPGATAGAG